ncbi:hypothetical protein KJY78_01590 [Canibacter sp. lx-45]|uniref:hypothetical protein n=1 Tax=Canibacter zhuwentaonis TaxID=2837491 RepID=UPI001BDC54E2|nr:hypothetical protein [Canibacter zhuwentaonis]MBT1035047.1 hypothetical protein [Canibacter zhuwentaonis]
MNQQPLMQGAKSIPPEIYMLKQTALDAHHRRGELVRCGFGYVLSSEPISPAARLLSYGKYLSHSVVVCSQSAAWVWGALNTCPQKIYLNPMPGASRIKTEKLAPLGEQHLFELKHTRLSTPEIVSFGGFRVTTQMRTLYDILFNTLTVEFTPKLRRACRMLTLQLGLSGADVRVLCASKRHPNKVRALSNIDLVWN